MEVIHRVLGHSHKIITERYLGSIDDPVAETMYNFGWAMEEKSYNRIDIKEPKHWKLQSLFG